MRIPLVAPLALALLAACQGDPSTGRPPPPPPPTGVSAAIAVRDASGRAGPFRLDGIDRLVVEASCLGLEAGAHPARIDVLTPRGTLHAQWQGTLTVGDSGQATLSRALEVAGTSIESFHQVGTWRFVLTVDDGAPLASAEVSLVE